MSNVAITQHNFMSVSDSTIGHLLVLLCSMAVVALGWAAWRRRRGRNAPDMPIVGGFWLVVRLGLLVVGLPLSGRPGDDWLTVALDLVGLVLLAWPFLAPPLPVRRADQLAGIGLLAVALACGVALWQWTRGVLGLPPTQPQPAVTWAHSTLILAGLAALNLLRRPIHRLTWILTAVGALVVGVGGMLIPLAVAPSLSSVLPTATAALAAAVLNWLERSPWEVAPVASDREVSPGPQRPFHWLKVSTALFVAPDLTQLLRAATTMMTHVVDVQAAGLILAEEDESLRLRLVARCPQAGRLETLSPLSLDLSPLLADTLAQGKIAHAVRESDRSLMESLDRALGTELEAVLILPLIAEPGVRGLLVLGHKKAVFGASQLQLCGTLADQVAIAIGYLQLRVKTVQQARSLAHLVRQREQLVDLWEQNRRLEETVGYLWELVWAGEIELALSETDLQELIEDAAISVTSLIGDKPVTLVRALEFGLPVIRADRARVRQVLVNLLTNAVRHVEEGQIAVSAAHGRGYVVTSIAHLGTGISPQYVEAVYEGFGRVGDSISQKVDGLRLGLSISRRLIELHGGRTWARKGKAVILYFGLPIDGPPSVEANQEVT